WKKVKYSMGGYASGARGGTRRTQLSKVENRIVIGSAVTAPYSEPDWQEGAVAAGWQALKSIHERAMRTQRPRSTQKSQNTLSQIYLCEFREFFVECRVKSGPLRSCSRTTRRSSRPSRKIPRHRATL